MTVQENVRDEIYGKMLDQSFSNLPYIMENSLLDQPYDHYHGRGIGWACLEAAVYCVNAMGEAGRNVTFHSGTIPKKGWLHFAAIDHEDDKDVLLDAGMLIDQGLEIPQYGKSEFDLPSKGVKLERDGDKIKVYFIFKGMMPQSCNYQLSLNPGKMPERKIPIFPEISMVRLENGRLCSLSYLSPGKVFVRELSKDHKSQRRLSSFSEIADLFKVDEEQLRAANEIVRVTPNGKPIEF